MPDFDSNLTEFKSLIESLVSLILLVILNQTYYFSQLLMYKYKYGL